MLRKNPRIRQMAAGYLLFISGELMVTQSSPFGYNDQFLVRYIIFVYSSLLIAEGVCISSRTCLPLWYSDVYHLMIDACTRDISASAVGKSLLSPDHSSFISLFLTSGLKKCSNSLNNIFSHCGLTGKIIIAITANKYAWCCLVYF